MAVPDGRAPRSAVMRSAVMRSAVLGSAVSRSFVALRNDETRVVPERSCTPEWLRS
jgi:hypothetical protein